MTVYVLAGPPAAGKSTLAWSLAGPADVVLDFDRICQELGSDSRHGHPVEVRDKAETEMQRRMWRLQFHDANAYVIRWAPKPAQRHALATRLGATVWVINPGEAECNRRAALDNRPSHTREAIAEWYRLFKPSRVDSPCPHIKTTNNGELAALNSREW